MKSGSRKPVRYGSFVTGADGALVRRRERISPPERDIRPGRVNLKYW
jgi:hypothetical protein